jgi:Response regulator containing CheY-like receiver, AAA-type ATPase, and DNA-binding domains
MTSRQQKILLVDDDPGLLKLLTIRFRNAGYEVDTVESGEKAFAHLLVFRPQLVITDLRMDGVDGLTLAEEISQHNPSLPVIILTAHGTIPEAVQATHQGVFSFITKPFDSKELLEHVSRALRIAGVQGSECTSDEADYQWRDGIITRSSNMEDLLAQARLVARTDASVFIYGESGTGKELLALAIHRASRRRDKPFIAVNCGAIPETLLESELFGHRKGAFTGAIQHYEGLFRAADQGTLFFDEIGDMPPALQIKLLRVLQQNQVRPLGSTETVNVDVRVISATHRNIDEELAQGNFRPDLYYRLNVVTLELPSLAQRRADIPLLAHHFLSMLSRKNNKNVKSFSPEAMDLLLSAPWPGNVRELLNVVEQCMALSTTPVISAALVQTALRDKPSTLLSFAEARSRFERDYLAQVLQMTDGNVSKAARLAKRNRTEFYKLLNRHQLDPALFKSSK